MADKRKNNLLKLNDLSVAELKAKLEEARRANFDGRLQKATGQLTKTSELPRTRAEIARILTILKRKGA
ncbi:50S ribosomal protein L29 [Desulfovibrio litoralis]|uniref:Large ribosomal subunit protein uL29 n=1 Tax=Desulfovibrio litoralis DSM 11393 TaxID=1121455 RepID=A0A1M7SE50_9BACT|nr:50S ribosomal protein L29 [Desulfovibrio litoralis]SHN56724.1 large subunit ribosomal protein L29 [Desulfovibrio litoralis DSM 11393]